MSEGKGTNAGFPNGGNWRIHFALLVWGLLALSTELWLRGWSLAIGVGGVVPGLLVYSMSRAWHEAWFWISIAAVAVLQVPLMIYAQPFIVRLKFSFLFPFAFIDYLSAAVLMQCVALVFSEVYTRTQK